MLSARPAPAHQQVHVPRVPDRNTAAWPAELPPPTTTISSPRQSCASTCVAA